MAKNLNRKKETPLLIQKKNTLVYSLYLVIGSVSIFIALNVLNTAYQGFIWSYTTKYVTNSLAIALVLLIASALLFMGCYQILKGKKFSYILGAIGCLLLIVYPGYVLLIDFYVPYAFYYMLLLWIPALIVLIVAVLVWKKQK
jgi:L-asparagine transporter-like permease